MRNGVRFLFLGCLAALGLAACATLHESSGAPASSFRTLRRASGGEKQEVVTARTPEELKDLWSLLFANDKTPPPVPAVDFSKETVIAVFRGCLPNTCYATAVKQVSPAADGMTVWVEDTDPGADCVCGMAITCPYHLVAVPRFEGTAEVRRSTKTTICAPQRRR